MPTRIRRDAALLLAIAAVFLAAAIAVALRRAPWCDEAWFACAGFNLAAHGKLVTPVIAPAPDDPKTLGLAEHTYWVMPLHLIFQAGWYQLFGFSLFALRSVSILWGLVALGAWFLIVRALTGETPVAILTMALLGTDFVFVMRAADGRMDMMSAALGYSALAAYLVLRNRSLNLAVLCAHGLVVLSGLTHPNGGLLSFAGVLFLMFYCDRRSLRPRHAALAAIPYVAGLAAWGPYIAQDPKLFLTQFGGNASGRLSDALRPWLAVRREIQDRYLATFGWHSGAPAAAKIRLLILAGYLIGAAGTLAAAPLRRLRGVRALMILAAMHVLFLTFESVKHPAYLVYTIPFFSALLALWIVWCRSRSRRLFAAVVLGAIAFTGLQLGSIAHVVARDDYRRTYLPAAAFVKAHALPTDVVMGEPEMGFALGFDTAFIDDRRLGYYSHTVPRFIVLGGDYPATFEMFRRERPDIAKHIDAMLASRYAPCYQNELYTVYCAAKP
jgi:4-amino-4-deoxy-L-arabinose transferase-like glycosyltransferase